MVAIADLALAGMSSMAQVLYPALPVLGLSSEDVAATLVRTMQSSQDSAAFWTRPGGPWLAFNPVLRNTACKAAQQQRRLPVAGCP